MVSLLWLKLARNDNIPSPRDIVNKANWMRLFERETLDFNLNCSLLY